MAQVSQVCLRSVRISIIRNSDKDRDRETRKLEDDVSGGLHPHVIAMQARDIYR